ncbi:hypothetical protein BH23BAC3_BH23BAC3_03500 [soil metagenome]
MDSVNIKLFIFRNWQESDLKKMDEKLNSCSCCAPGTDKNSERVIGWFLKDISLFYKT